MKPWKVVIIAHAVVFALIIAFAWYEVRHGFSARETPSYIETLAATAARKLAVPSAYRNLHNPTPATPENIRAGMEHFADHCATCHANDGSGDTMFGKGLYPKPPDMRKPETQNKMDGELCYTIQNGVRLSGMPAFGEEHGTDAGDTDTWHLVLFIRHLPNLTPGELQQMEQLNPRTEEERQEEKQEEEFLRGGNPQIQDGSSHHH
ncbi:MAG TPA: cytochrome c [Candidatus Acidoferrales bacterium]|nr:cytochrome c [Candidatus Acidoferrales bacterium]